MNIQIINGPNLNLLGKREPSIYGNESFEVYFESLQKRFASEKLHYFQSNVEGEIVNKLHETGVIAASEADQNRAALNSARALVAQYQAQLAVAELPARDAQQAATTSLGPAIQPILRPGNPNGLDIVPTLIPCPPLFRIGGAIGG